MARYLTNNEYQELGRALRDVVDAFRSMRRCANDGTTAFGFTPSQVAQAVASETAEFREALAEDDPAHIAEECADVLGGAVNLVDVTGLDLHTALVSISRKITGRLSWVHKGHTWKEAKALYEAKGFAR